MEARGIAYKQVLEINPENAAAREGLGVSMLKQGKHDEAKTILEDLLVYYPGMWRAHNSLGVIYDMKQQHENAVSSFNRALEYNKKNAEVLNNLGYSYYLSGRWSLAKKYFLDALNADRNDSFLDLSSELPS